MNRLWALYVLCTCSLCKRGGGVNRRRLCDAVPDRSNIVYLCGVAPGTAIRAVAQRFTAAGLGMPLQILWVGRGVLRVITQQPHVSQLQRQLNHHGLGGTRGPGGGAGGAGGGAHSLFTPPQLTTPRTSTCLSLSRSPPPVNSTHVSALLSAQFSLGSQANMCVNGEPWQEVGPASRQSPTAPPYNRD